MNAGFNFLKKFSLSNFEMKYIKGGNEGTVELTESGGSSDGGGHERPIIVISKPKPPK